MREQELQEHLDRNQENGDTDDDDDYYDDREMLPRDASPSPSPDPSIQQQMEMMEPVMLGPAPTVCTPNLTPNSSSGNLNMTMVLPPSQTPVPQGSPQVAPKSPMRNVVKVYLPNHQKTMVRAGFVNLLNG